MNLQNDTPSTAGIDRCWVCVLWNAERDDYLIRLTGDPSCPDLADNSKDWQPVYCREFPDTVAATGYRIALSRISRQSLVGIIHRECGIKPASGIKKQL